MVSDSIICSEKRSGRQRQAAGPYLPVSTVASRAKVKGKRTPPSSPSRLGSPAATVTPTENEVVALPRVALEATAASRAKQRERYFGLGEVKQQLGLDLAGPLPRSGRETVRSDDGPELLQILQEATAGVESQSIGSPIDRGGAGSIGSTTAVETAIKTAVPAATERKLAAFNDEIELQVRRAVAQRAQPESWAAWECTFAPRINRQSREWGYDDHTFSHLVVLQP